MYIRLFLLFLVLGTCLVALTMSVAFCVYAFTRLLDYVFIDILALVPNDRSVYGSMVFFMSLLFTLAVLNYLETILGVKGSNLILKIVEKILGD